MAQDTDEATAQAALFNLQRLAKARRLVARTRSLLLGEESIEYGRPIVAGDRLTVKSRVADVQERAGTSGASDVLVLETEGRGAEGDFVFRTRETFILRRG